MFKNVKNVRKCLKNLSMFKNLTSIVRKGEAAAWRRGEGPGLPAGHPCPAPRPGGGVPGARATAAALTGYWDWEK